MYIVAGAFAALGGHSEIGSCCWMHETDYVTVTVRVALTVPLRVSLRTCRVTL